MPPMAFQPGPRSLSPGLSGCIPVGTGLQEDAAIFDGSGPLGGVATADLNGDGMGDMLLLAGNEVIIYYGQGSGEGVFGGPAQRLSIPGPSFPMGIDVGDLDHDGRLDIVTGDGTALAVFLQTSPGSFQLSSPAVPNLAGGVSLGDINGDGFLDIAVLPSGGPFMWLLNNGDGTFGPAASAPCNSAASTSAVSPLTDLDGDGKADLACSDSADLLHFFRGTATGLQDTGITRPSPAGARHIATGDLDGDGRKDLAITTQGATLKLQTLKNLGVFQFTVGSDLPLTTVPQDVKIAELTGDSFGDVVLVDDTPTLIEYQGTGAGAVSPFFTVPVFGIVGLTDMLAIGDVNTDGNLDVVLGDSSPSVRALPARRSIPAGADTLSFVAAPTTRIINVLRGPSQYAWDFELQRAGGGGHQHRGLPTGQHAPAVAAGPGRAERDVVSGDLPDERSGHAQHEQLPRAPEHRGGGWVRLVSVALSEVTVAPARWRPPRRPGPSRPPGRAEGGARTPARA